MMRDPVLWDALKDHPLPLTRRRPADAHRLIMRVLRLDENSARAMLVEYRRFLYLAAVAGREVVAPPVIHHVWQAHAKDHQSYTVALQRGVIGRPMPDPFDLPPPLSDPAHVRTRALYLEEFGEPPPRRLWPGAVSMAAEHVLKWFTIGCGGLVALLLMSQEPAWAAISGLAALTSEVARNRLTPWTVKKRDNDVDLDFGANRDGSNELDLFGD